MLTSSTATAIVTTLVLVTVTACAGPTSTPSAPVASAPASTLAPPSLASSPSQARSPSAGITDLAAAGALTIHAPDAPDFAILAGDYLFTTDVSGGMEVYDQDGKQLFKLDIPGGACAAPDAGFGAVWTATCDQTPGLVRVDTSSLYAAPVDTGGPIPTSEATIGVGEGGVWMIRAAKSIELIKINPQVQSRQVVYSEPAPTGALSVRVGFGSVWVSSPSTNTITRIDPTTGAQLAAIKVGNQPQFFVCGEDAVWTLDQLGGSVSRIDPTTNTVVATIDLGEVVEGGDIAVGGGFVWARSSATLLFQIDAQTNQIVARYGPSSGSGSVAADDNYAWITAHDIETIWRLAVQ